MKKIIVYWIVKSKLTKIAKSKCICVERTLRSNLNDHDPNINDYKKNLEKKLFRFDNLNLTNHPWRTNTMEILQERNPDSCLDPQWCTLYQSNSEGIDHLFVNYRTNGFPLEPSIHLYKQLVNNSFKNILHIGCQLIMVFFKKYYCRSWLFPFL